MLQNPTIRLWHILLFFLFIVFHMYVSCGGGGTADVDSLDVVEC